MLQVLEQCLGLTDKDITTAPFKLPATASLDRPTRKCLTERDHSMLPEVQQNASDRLSSYCSQSAGTVSDGSDWSGLTSSDFEDRASACTSPCSTASTALISLCAPGVKCTRMLQFLEQRLGLTDKDITTAPFNLPQLHLIYLRATVRQRGPESRKAHMLHALMAALVQMPHQGICLTFRQYAEYGRAGAACLGVGGGPRRYGDSGGAPIREFGPMLPSDEAGMCRFLGLEVRIDENLVRCP